MVFTKFRTLFFTILVLFITGASIAQVLPDASKISDKQIQQMLNEINDRNLSEAEVELMAKSRGYSDTDIIVIKERIDRMKSGLDAQNDIKDNTVAREQLGEVSERVETEERTTDVRTKRVFGKDIFNLHKVTFEPNIKMATPMDYVLGVDDEFSVFITGYAVANYNLKVSPEGTIRLENLAPIYINGLTVQQAKSKITQNLGTLFAGLRNGSLKLDLVLNKVKTIKVAMAGEIANPGTYTVSSLATIFNALYLSGGPKDNGSLRNIQLIRDNQIIRTLDVYDFLMKGTLEDNISLQDRDVIFIPLAGVMVDFDGEVKRPLRFELKPSESFDDALNYAGGFTDNAYRSRVTLTRNTDKEKEIKTLDKTQYENFLLKNGDKLRVDAILDRFTNKVEIFGAVFRPGEYALGENIKTVGDLIKSADGLREDAFKNRAFIKRLGENLDPILIPINLDSVLAGYDFPLQREDALTIKSIVELRELRTVRVSGFINVPGEFDFADNMTLNDLIAMAGGFKEGGSSQRIEVSRRVQDSDSFEKNIDIFTLNVTKDFSSEAGNFKLSPFDVVIVRELPNYEVQKYVQITGQVLYPGHYAVAGRNERISDLVKRSGGLRDEAHLKGATFYRNGKIVALNLKSALENPQKEFNLILQNGDSLHIPLEQQTVHIRGQVLSPADVAFQSHYNIKDFISQAGGFTDSAFVKKTYVTYVNGISANTKSFLGIKKFPHVEPGMTITVPVKRRERMSKAEVISISTGMVSLSAVLLTLFRLL